MRYTLDEIETFLTVIDLGTVTAAAARLNLAKSVVSKRIVDLEGKLGAALFRRNAGRITPTEAALRLAEGLRPALSALQTATEAAALNPDAPEVLRGKLSISAPMSFSTLHLGPILAEFAKAHPELKLTLDYDDRERDLMREGYDVGIRIGQNHGQALMMRKLCEDRAVVCAAPSLLERLGTPQHPADLAGAPAIGYSALSNAAIWQFQTASGPISPQLSEAVTVNNGEALRDFAIAGVGFAMIPGFIASPALQAGSLVEVLPQYPSRQLPVYVVWPPLSPLPLKLRRFIDHLAAAFAGGPPWLSR